MASDRDTRLELQYAETRPPWVPGEWGLTVACGEHQHEDCGGVRKWRTFISGEMRTAGPCTCRCHQERAEATRSERDDDDAR